MQGLIIPGVLLVMLAVWAVFENGRKFRREFHKRGMTWESAQQQVKSGAGAFVVDELWGPQRGLGRPVVWYVASAEEGELAGRIEAGDAKLVACPRGLKSTEALKGKFGAERVLVHSWNVSQELMESVPR